MDFAPVYLISRFFYRLWDFFHHWYVDAPRQIHHRIMNIFEGFDQVFAVRITLKYFFAPLYGDYTAMGHILGVLFRTGRIMIGSVLFLALAACAATIYLVWVLIPPAILVLAIKNLYGGNPS